MADTLALSRRGFLISSGAAGLTISVLGGCANGSTEAEEAAENLPPNPEVNAWVIIGRDDVVTVRIARSEMGQGTMTGLAQLVAEELDADWDKVVAEFPTPGENLARQRVWKDFSTGGSRGVRGSIPYVQEGAAAARAMLLQAAADEWGVPVSEVSVSKGVISHGDKTLTYGAVAEAASKVTPPENVTLKDPSEWTIVGQPKKRLDTAEKLTGDLVYGADIQLDGMVCASIKACPVRNGKLGSFDEAAIADMPGVKKVMAVGEDAVAVVADTWWKANKAIEALPITWEGGDKFNSADFEEVLNEGLTADDAAVGYAVGEDGALDAAFDSAATTVDVVYNMPFQNHAPMEPMNATALYTDEKCEVWCPTQNGEAALAAAAQASGLDIGKCEVYKTILGGGFGRRGMADYVTQAVTIAKAMPGTPVKLLWSREEDQRQGFYHPTTKARVRGALDADGNLTGVHVRISGQSILAGIMPQAVRGGLDSAVFQGLGDPNNPRSADQSLKYTFPAFKADHAMRNPPVRPGFWRGVNANQNAIYLDCLMDELAVAAGEDPLEFRLKYLKDSPKGQAVLNAVAEKSGWGSDDGKSRGLCFNYSFGSYTASCAEVTVDDRGQLKIDRIVAATDPGYAVNPQQIEAQVQGSFVYGLSAMLYGNITFVDGEVQETNFDRYNSMRIAEMPKVETIVMPSGGFWGGVGEPTISVAPPAVLNAIYAATGNRVRELPLNYRNLREA
ncbi:MAG: aldehyde dehydrogenase [Ponticaulis sp.]|nr:aldehyde dehydrogenase [Ponticaulis sp.]|tara:strand:+ start:17160 stop:19352 length:2193 start_codon:yes stop_codon:yes gene_type:complete